MKSFIMALIMLIIGTAIGYFGQPHIAMLTPSPAPTDQNMKSEKEIDYWVAPMDANFRRDKPGKSPMGMDLVPVYKVSGDADPDAVKIAPEVMNNMGVRTARVKMAQIAKQIKTLGYVRYDETKISHLHLKTKGWIETLYVKTEGEQVKRGQLLFEIYSPDLVNAQEEYLRTFNSKLKGIKSASKTRLASLGMSKGQIKRLVKRGIPYQRISVYAPRSGIISKLNVGEGMYVKPEMNIMTIADLRQVWLMVDVFERQANWVKVGQEVVAYFSYLPEKKWYGKVDYIYPDLNPKTRSLKVRLVFKNLGGQLKPNMYGKVQIATNPKNNALVIPSQAVIRSGNENHVIIKTAAGGFKQRPIKIGIEDGHLVEVVSGLAKNDEIVTSAMFLIDSEASLKASFKRMEPMAEEMDNMGDMDMSDQKSMKKEQTKFNGQGVVEDVMANNMITLTHQPIKDLGWGEMTMDLKVDPKVDLKGLKVGQDIHFTIEKRKNHQYVIVFIHRMNGEM